MLLQIQDGTLSIGAQTVLAHFDFEIRGNEKIAIVGRNGCGKTTLLRLLAGELSLDRDDHSKAQGILTSRSLTTGLLCQQAFSPFPWRKNFSNPVHVLTNGIGNVSPGNRNMTGSSLVSDFPKKIKGKGCRSSLAASRRRLP